MHYNFTAAINFKFENRFDFKMKMLQFEEHQILKESDKPLNGSGSIVEESYCQIAKVYH